MVQLMIPDWLSEKYLRLEEAWYGLVDAVSAKGIPLYVYTDFLDKRGIPSFPFTVALILLLAIVLFLMLSSTAINVNLKLYFMDREGNTLNGVRIKITNSEGEEIYSERTSSGSIHELRGMEFNSKIYIEAFKEGFDSPQKKELLVNEKEVNVRLYFAKQRYYINGVLRLYDSETQTLIKNAECSAVLPDERVVVGRNSDANILFSNIPENEEINVSCSANGYESLNELISFEKGKIAEASMSPKAGFSEKDRVEVLIRALNQNSELIPNTRVIIINAEQDTVISDDNSATGEYIAELIKGSVVKITLEAEGYTTLTTDPFTVVEDMKPVEVKMKKGGESVTVTVTSKSGVGLQDVVLMLFDEQGNMIGAPKKTTRGPFGGNAAFSGLDPNKEYYLTAYKPGFLPYRVKFSPSEKSDLEIELENTNPKNSARSVLTVLDSEGNPAKKAKVKFYEKVDGKKLPLGIPPMETDAFGKAAVQLPEGKVIVEVEDDLEKKTTTLDVKPGETIEETIGMKRKPSIVELKFLDSEGNPIEGKVTIRSKSGEVLFEGRPDDSGSVVFDSKGEESFDAEVETEDGKTFEEEVRLGDKKEGTVTIYTKEEKLRPSIEFVGALDESGEKVQGLRKSRFYWLKFVVNWKAIDSAGIHIRVGEDSESFAKSMEYGIYGFDGIAKRFFYGKSYQPPLGVREDKQNRGRAGEKNKLLELYFDEPADQQVIKIKVKVLEEAKVRELEFHYRAWVGAGEKFFRDPADQELGNQGGTNNKASFYAETYSDSIKVHEGKPKCKKGICLDFSFVDSEGVKYRPEKFRPIMDREYSLETSVSVDSVKDIQLTAETREEKPTIQFSEFKKSALEINPLSPYKQTSVSTESISISEFEEKKARAFFKTVAQGAAVIRVTAQEEENKVEEELYFKITGLRKMKVEIESTKIKPGEPLKLSIQDAETSEPIENAGFSFYVNERPTISIQGDGSEGNGLNGQYALKLDSLEPGIYGMVISKRDYMDFEEEIIVSTENILGIEEEKEFFMEENNTERIKTLEVWNNLTTADIESLTYTFTPQSNWEPNFELEVRVPDKIRGGGKNHLSLTVSYIGPQKNRVHAEGELTVSGILGNGLRVEGTSIIKANYNKPVPTDCLEVTPQNNEVRVMGEENANESFDLTVKYIQSDQCTDPLVLRTRIESKGEPDQDLRVSAPQLSISPGQEKNLTVTVTNLIPRRPDEPDESKEFRLILDSAKVSKSVGLKVFFINPYFSLQTNDNIHLWATVGEDGKIGGIAPLFVRNAGKKTIKNITATESGKAPKSDLFSVKVKPTQSGTGIPRPEAKATLEPGQEISPPWTIEVTGETLDYPENIYRIYLDVSGVIEGKKYQPLRTVTIWVHVSTAKCLKIRPKTNLIYESKESSQGVLSKTVILENDCGEPLREISVAPNLLGQNQLSLYRAGQLNALDVGEKAEFELKLLKRSDYFTEEGNPEMVNARGFLVSSQKFIDSRALPIVLQLGPVPETEKGPVLGEVEMPVCESDQIKNVAFPKTATEDDCEHAYCDAVQVSWFMANKLLDSVENASDVMRNNDFDAKNFNCDSDASFCTFYSMGITPPEFTVFLQNDYVSSEVIEKGIEEAAPSLSNYKAEFRAGEMSEIIERGTGFTPFHVYLNQPLEGCGRYSFRIFGAVQNASGALQEKNIVLMVEVSDRSITPECTNKVQNIMNFLPVDNALTHRKTLNTWLGLIKTDQKLEKVGEDFAEAIFGKREGRVVRNTSSNRMEILLKDIEKGRIMKLWIDQRSETTASPKKMTLELNGLFDEAAQQVRNEIATKAKEGLRAMKQGSFALDACISENEQFMKVSRFKKLGELSIEGDSVLPLYYDLEACADLEVKGTLKNERVLLKTNWNSMNANEKAGLLDVYIKVGGQRIVEYNNQKNEQPSPIQLEPVEGKEGLYSKKFQLCARGNNGEVVKAIGTNLRVKAKSHSIEKEMEEGEVRVREMKEWHSVKIEVCGMHPYDLLKKVSGLEPEKGETIEAFTVLAWKGEPNVLTLDSMIAAYRAFKEKQKATPDEESRLTYEEKREKINNLSIWVYFGSCSAAASVCNGALLRAWFVPFDILMDCGIPTIAGFFGPQLSGGAKNVWENMKGWFHTDTTEKWVDQVQSVGGGTGEAGENIENLEEEIITGAMVGISFRGAKEFIPPSHRGTFATPESAKTAINSTADNILNKVTDEWADDILKGSDAYEQAYKPARKTMRKKIIDNLAKSAEGKTDFKLEDLDVEAASRSAWDDAGGEMTQKLVNQPELLKNSKLGSKMDEILNRSVDDLIDSGKVSGNSVDDLYSDLSNRLTPEGKIKVGTDGIYSDADELADELTDRALRQFNYDDLAAKESGLRGLRGDLKEKIMKNLGEVSDDATLGKGQLKRALHNSVDNAKLSYQDDLARAAGKNVDDQVREMLEKSYSGRTMDELPKGGRIKNFFRNLRTRGFWTRLAKGMACGVLANLAGLYAKQAFLNWRLDQLAGEEQVGEGFDFEGPLANYEGAESFKKFKPYHVIISKKDSASYLKIEELIEPDQLKEMDKKIKKDKSKYWPEDKSKCEDFLNRPVDKVIGCVVPKAEGSVTEEQVLAYYSNNALIADVCLKEQQKVLEEELLMAALFTQPSKICSCEINDQWYNRSEGEIESSIRCAAKELRQALTEENNVLEKALEKLVRKCPDESNPLEYRSRVLETYGTWRAFDNLCRKS